MCTDALESRLEKYLCGDSVRGSALDGGNFKQSFAVCYIALTLRLQYI